MKISICITYYNQKEFIRQSLDSVLAIDFPCDFEILCGDDGSNDGTLDIIREYAQKYSDKIKFFIMPRTEKCKSINRASANRLNLAENAVGDYIMFLDGDDFYCDRNFVKDALDVFAKDQNISVCAFNFKYLYPDNSQNIFSQRMSKGIIDNRIYISKGIYTHSGACIFKNVLTADRLKFLKEINIFDDNANTIYMLQFGKMYYIDKTIYVYRQIADSLWNNVNATEKDILSSLDFKLISTYAPVFKYEIAKRQYFAIKKLYVNRKNLKKSAREKFKKYSDIARSYNDIFIMNLLNWHDLTVTQKFKTDLLWICINYYRIIAALKNNLK